MSRIIVILVALGLFTGCAQRGTIQHATPSDLATAHDVWVVNFRSDAPTPDGQRTPPRPEHPTYEKNVVSVPPTHQAGEIEWTQTTPDAATDFATLAIEPIGDLTTFARDIAAGDDGRETMLFVHGYNMNHAESVYFTTQIKHDFNVVSPTVLFSWQSAGVGAGYIYDRDSTLYARNTLEQVIHALSKDTDRELVIVAHSLGGFLVMETLRQMAHKGDFDIGANIATLAMISPDIDGELFRAQAGDLTSFPQHTIVLASAQDKALKVSALLTGRQNRLGNVTDRSAIEGFPISLIDASDLANGGLNHSVALTSPTAISIISNMVAQGNIAPEADLPLFIDLGNFIETP